MFLKIDSQSGSVISAFCIVQGPFNHTNLQCCKSEEKMTNVVWDSYSGGRVDLSIFGDVTACRFC